MTPAMTERIDTLRADLLESYRLAGAENGEPFTPKCFHPAIYELTTPVDDVDHASYTGMCRNAHCGAFLSVVEYKTARPNEIDVLTGRALSDARLLWLAQLNCEVE